MSYVYTASSINAGAVGVLNLTELRAFANTKTKTVNTAGYANAGDGGGGEYWYDSTDLVSADNGFTVIVGADGRRWKLQSVGGKYHVKQGGAVGNNTTENRSRFVAMLAALSSGGELDTGKETDVYKITATTSPVFTIPANLKITGTGTLNLSSASTSFFQVFSLSAGSALFKDISINWTTPVGSSGIVMFLFGSGNDITFDGIRVDAGVTDIGGGLLSASNHLFSIGGNASNVRVINKCYFTKFKFGILKTNASTAVNKDWTFDDSKFETFYSPALTFNTPSGDWDGVRVTNCELKDNLGNAFGFYPHMGGLAGGTGSGKYHFSNNRLLGEGRGWHFEEGAEQVIIDGDIIAVNDTAISVVDNFVGGPVLTPTNFIITNCVITQTGTAAYDAGSVRGVDFTFDASGASAISKSIVAGNIITGYDIGVQLPEDPEDTGVKDNSIVDCVIGLRAHRVSSSIEGNTFIGCPTGINNTNRGGVLGHNSFVNCAEPFLDTSAYNSSSSQFSVNVKDYNLATGTNPIDLLTLPSRAYGLLTFSLWSVTGASTRYATFEITWDGATLTATSKTASGSGNILTPTVINNAGKLALSMNNSTGAARLTSVEAVFTGGWHLA